MDDIFEKIIRGEIPAAKVYEDEKTLAFLDIKPVHKGHVLVIPKTKYRNILDLPLQDLKAMVETTQKIAIALKATLRADGINIHMNNEAAGGQEIFHAHLHIIPRYSNDNVFQKPTHESYEKGEIDVYAENIKAHLA